MLAICADASAELGAHLRCLPDDLERGTACRPDAGDGDPARSPALLDHHEAVRMTRADGPAQVEPAASADRLEGDQVLYGDADGWLRGRADERRLVRRPLRGLDSEPEGAGRICRRRRQQGERRSPELLP